jgi:hypothetical protein
VHGVNKNKIELHVGDLQFVVTSADTTCAEDAVFHLWDRSGVTHSHIVER